MSKLACSLVKLNVGNNFNQKYQLNVNCVKHCTDMQIKL